MRRLLLILLATAPLTGCSFLSQGEDIELITPTEITNAGEAVIAEALNAGADEEAVAFDDPVVDGATTPVVTADLIRSTDPVARAQQVSRSRTDPFASLPIPLAVQAVEIPAAASNGGAAGSGGTTTTTTATANNPGPTPPPVRAQPPNEPLVQPTPIAALPSVPRPVIAPTVSVSGIVQLGGEPYAILRAGSEPERYVRVGDRIAGGVRVKRIDTLAFEPQVILEENGIEVSRPVGDGGTEAEAGPVAALPPLATPATSAAPTPAAQTTAPGLPPIAPASAAPLLPPQSEVPGSLLLSPAESATQAVLPNLQVEVPDAV